MKPTAGWTSRDEEEQVGYRKGVADFRQRPNFKMRSLVEGFRGGGEATDTKESSKFLIIKFINCGNFREDHPISPSPFY